MDTDTGRWLKLKSGPDIRSREDVLTDETCARIGYAFARMLAQRLHTTPDLLTIAVGRDTRPSGARVQAALIRGITAADADVLDGGVCVIPALFSRVARGTGGAAVHGAAMVTGGVMDPRINGFKFLTREGSLSEADMALLLRMAATERVPKRLVTPLDPMEDYRTELIARAAVLLQDDALRPLLGLYAAVDASTLGGAFFADLMESLGADVERVDGRELGAATARLEADLGFAFDADCSRAWLFDSAGRAVDGNRLIAMLAAWLLDQHPGLTIVTDSDTSTGLSAFIAEWAGVHYRFKRGYRNVIDEAIRLNREGIDCPLAIETSGHAAFRENDFLDDGIYLALRVACLALDRKREGRTIFDPLIDLSEPVETKSLRLRILDEEDLAAASQEIVEVILSHTLENPEWHMSPDSREGVRITFNLDGGINNAWFQLRMSVHDPIMVLSAESDVRGGIRRMLEDLYALIRDTALLDLEPLREAVQGKN